MVGFYWSLKRSQNKRIKATKIKGETHGNPIFSGYLLIEICLVIVIADILFSRTHDV